jgi:hypothetical protein
MTIFPVYCSAQCLKALKDGEFHPDCPNAEDHGGKKFTLEAVINDVLESVELGQVKFVAGGNSAKCVAVRSVSYGHGMIIKMYDEKTEHYLYEKELEIYNHLSDLQGLYLPVILAAFEWAIGAPSPLIVMSYGGIPLHRSSPNDELIDELSKAALAICAHGVVIDDSSTDNVLVHENKVAVIDFESAFIVNPPNPAALQQYKAEIESVAEKVKISGNLRALLP